MKPLKVLTMLLLISAVVVAMTGCGSKISKSNYDKIKTGMTLSEVQGILGPGVEQASAGGVLGKITAAGKIVKWTDGKKSITITFVDDKVKVMTHTGL